MLFFFFFLLACAVVLPRPVNTLWCLHLNLKAFCSPLKKTHKTHHYRQTVVGHTQVKHTKTAGNLDIGVLRWSSRSTLFQQQACHSKGCPAEIFLSSHPNGLTRQNIIVRACGQSKIDKLLENNLHSHQDETPTEPAEVCTSTSCKPRPSCVLRVSLGSRYFQGWSS